MKGFALVMQLIKIIPGFSMKFIYLYTRICIQFEDHHEIKIEHNNNTSV